MQEQGNIAKTSIKKIDKAGLMIVITLVFLVGFVLGDHSHTILQKLGSLIGLPLTSTALDYSSLDELYTHITAKYDGKINRDKLLEGAARGMAMSLGDDYTVYLNKEEVAEFKKSLSGEIGGGIGAEVGIRNKLPTVIRPLKDSPAARAGVMAGDIIYKVDGQDVTNLSLDETIQKIRGKIGTEVKLSLVRNGVNNFIETTITREEINNPSVSGEQRGKIGIITITRFDQETASLARAEAQKMLQNGASSFIIDLRGNTGGYLTAAQDLAGLWLDGELVVTERVDNQIRQELYAKKGGAILKNKPTVILANASSASASEIVIGALKDCNQATVIGEKTFGKGSVQELVDLKNGAQLKVTIARWHTPHGQNINKTGIEPDKKIELTADDWQHNRDPQLQAAIDTLNK
ncbi:MAG: S41 family peptidase [Candidatus Saccharibacteria bacterium]|nr:S41 family peptidase [Candidatus Saccharibacteria bacterium]